jgi:HTH-type transcriptional regulator/antitoxin HigA
MRTVGRRMKESYFGLVRRFPLEPIRGEAHHEAAIAVVRKLAVRDEAALDAGEKAYLAALTRFVEDYEDRHHAIELGERTPLDALRFLLESNGMKPADLGRLLGSRSVASQVLHGRRPLSKRHIAILAERFCVDPGLFFDTAGLLRKTG